MTMSTADELKTLGNQAFASGDYQKAIDLFTQAINVDAENHVLFSNRSAAYCACKKYQEALSDADCAIQLKPDWSKGYGRKGSALYGLGQLEAAEKAYKDGLQIEPTNAMLKKGLDEVKSAGMPPAGSDPFSSMFGPDLVAKIASNPKLSRYLADPSYMKIIQEVQANPQSFLNHLNDPRVMETVSALMGVNIQMGNPGAGGSESQADAAGESYFAQESKAETPPAADEPMPDAEPEAEESPEEREEREAKEQSKKFKEQGNQAYKAKKFQEALDFYSKAWDLEQSDITILTNKSAVYFEMNDFENCIKTAEEAAERGRELRADYKHIARAYGRIGSAYAKQDKLEDAIKFYQKSLTEHRTPDVLGKLRDTEKLKEQKDREAYQNPELAEESRNKGNTLFKEGKYADAIPCYTEAIKRAEKDPRGYSNRSACYAKLMALPEALKDAEKAIELDSTFIKGYVRKAAAQIAMREYTKAMQTCDSAVSIDTEHHNGKSRHEIEQLKNQAMMAMYGGGAAGNADENMSQEERAKNAMRDPKVQEILADPVMRQLLEQMSTNPAAAKDHLQNPMIREKIQILANAGIIGFR